MTKKGNLELEESVFGKPVEKSYEVIYAIVEKAIDLGSESRSKADSLVYGYKGSDEIRILRPVSYCPNFNDPCASRSTAPTLEAYYVLDGAVEYIISKNEMLKKRNSVLMDDVIFTSNHVRFRNTEIAVQQLETLLRFVHDKKKTTRT
jgi:hypothetical protein